MSVRSVGGAEFPISEAFLSSEEGLRDKLCKVCGKAGRRVLPVTMATHLDAERWALINEAYFFCFTPTCPIIYYNNRDDRYFSKHDVKTKFGPKEDSPPRPICYCLQVTEERIEEEILGKGCCYSLEDIEAYTRAGTGKWCLTTNPSGKCCREYLPQVVEKYLALAKGRPVEQQLRKVSALLEEPYQLVELSVSGMTCESCAVAVKSSIEQLGGRDVRVSLAGARAEASIPISLKPEEVAERVSEMGYDAKLVRVTRS